MFTPEQLQLQLWLVGKETKWIALYVPFQFYIVDKKDVYITNKLYLLLNMSFYVNMLFLICHVNDLRELNIIICLSVCLFVRLITDNISLFFISCILLFWR